MSTNNKETSETYETDWLETLELVNKLVLKATGKKLSEAQTIVLQCAWYRKQYKEIQNESYSETYLRSCVATGLWKLLSKIFDTRITKKYFRTFFDNLDRNEIHKLTQDVTILGGNIPETNIFYGREKDLAKIEQQILYQRLIILIGDTGIGKSSLAAKLLFNISKQPGRKFNTLVWKPIVYPIPLEDLIRDLFEILELENNPTFNLYQRISYLINQLRKSQALIVLDGFESIIQNLQYREEYIRFFRRLIEEGNNMSFLITSRIAFKQLEQLSNKNLVKHIQVFGLSIKESIKVLEKKGIKNLEMAEDLVKTYRGNPNALEELAEEITRYFGGDLQKYFKYKTTIVGERLLITLHNFFGKPGEISALQRSIMIFIADELSSENSKKPIEITKILDYFKAQNFPNRDIFSALKGLEGKLLIEPIEGNDYEICYSLQPGIKKYILSDPLGFVRSSS